MSEWNYIGAAYGLTWIVLAGYVVYLHGKVRRARHRLARAGQDREVGR